jgi:hypothetical protein
VSSKPPGLPSIFSLALSILQLLIRYTTEIAINKEIEMRFLSIFKARERNTPPTPQEMATMGKLIEEAMKAGWLIMTEGCLPSALGARVRRDGAKVSVTDGPFAESKELIGGFAILKAASKEEAVELCRRFLQVAGDGECELRQLYEAGAEMAS